jgi:restriction endonuclease S subunit
VIKPTWYKNAKPIIKAATASGRIVDLSKVGYVKQSFIGSKTVKEGDIFILSAAHQAEYVGKNVSLLAQQPLTETYYVGELIAIRALKNLCLPIYLFGFLSTKFAYVLLNREKRGQTSHLYPDDISELLIPLPPIKVQHKIANVISSRREKAARLQMDATHVLEQSKKQVEAMILSNS